MNPSTSFAPPAVKSGLSTDNPELMLDLLTGEFLLPHIAARHNIPLAALNSWIDTEEVQSLLESCRRISAWRARYMAIDSIPRAIHGLLMTMEQNPGTEIARRAATSIINLAFKRDLSVPQDAIGRARSDERDQCAESAQDHQRVRPTVLSPMRSVESVPMSRVDTRARNPVVSTPDQPDSACPAPLRENIPSDRLAEFEAQLADVPNTQISDPVSGIPVCVTAVPSSHSAVNGSTLPSKDTSVCSVPMCEIPSSPRAPT